MQDRASLRRHFYAELRASARPSALLVTYLILVLFPLWGLADLLLEPEHAREFVVARGVALAPVILLWFVLQRFPSSARFAEFIALANLSIVEIAIAWMLPHVEHSL